jgi:hypothetical protein
MVEATPARLHPASTPELHRRLQEDTKNKDVVVCRRSYGAVPRRSPNFPVVLDLPPGNIEMKFVLVLVPSRGTATG